MKRRHLGRVLGLTLALGLIGLFVAWFDSTTVEVRGEPTARARRNPLLAAERLLSAMGVPCRSLGGPATLPPTDTALLLMAPRWHFSAERQLQIVAWVEAGGHLIAQPDVEDELLERFGIQAAWPEVDDEAEDAPDEGVEPAVLEIRIAAGQTSPMRRVKLRLDSQLSGPEGAFESPATGPAILVSTRVGRGRVTAISRQPFENDAIGEAEHASLLWDIVSLDGRRPTGAWLVVWDELPSLLSILWHQQRALVVGLAIVIALWLRRLADRFGPLQADALPQRRSLLEHVEATGAYLWREGGAQRLIAATRSACLEAVTRARPTVRRADAARRVEWLADRLGESPERTRAMLESPIDHSPTRFTEQVRQLEAWRTR